MVPCQTGVWTGSAAPTMVSSGEFAVTPKAFIHIVGSRSSSGVESATTVRLMRHTRSAVAMAWARSWVVMTSVVPSAAKRQNSSVSIS